MFLVEIGMKTAPSVVMYAVPSTKTSDCLDRSSAGPSLRYLLNSSSTPAGGEQCTALAVQEEYFCCFKILVTTGRSVSGVVFMPMYM